MSLITCPDCNLQINTDYDTDHDADCLMKNSITLLHGDCIEEMKKLDDNSVDSIVTDPPYELGFMGKKWDSTGIANNVEMWSECLRVLKPGGHLLAFSGTRTYHRMASAIEDAGFEVRDMIEWVYGSGFPKSHNIGKAVDKLQGNEREVIPNPKAKQQTAAKDGIYGDYESTTYISKGTSEWEGWGTALKPAHEPICMARKPLSEKTVAKNVLKHGTAGININESRVESGEGVLERKEGAPTENVYDLGINKKKENRFIDNSIGLGRFPANLIHDNSEEVRECFPNESERFFKSIVYQAKASKSERNKGCEELEEKRQWASEKREASSFDIFQNGKPPMVNKNNHPTVKPVALMEYLIKMVTPKGGTVLDPFMGSGTTGIAAKQNGYDFMGIEMEEDYIKIAKARIDSV